jgi:hypothetical protein
MDIRIRFIEEESQAAACTTRMAQTLRRGTHSTLQKVARREASVLLAHLSQVHRAPKGSFGHGPSKHQGCWWRGTLKNDITCKQLEYLKRFSLQRSRYTSSIYLTITSSHKIGTGLKDNNNNGSGYVSIYKHYSATHSVTRPTTGIVLHAWVQLRPPRLRRRPADSRGLGPWSHGGRWWA